MRSQPYPYDLKGFFHALVFSACLAGATGLVTYLSAPESIQCERGADGAVSCTLTREPRGYAVHSRTLERVRGVDVRTQKSKDSDDTYVLLLRSPGDNMESVSVWEASEVHEAAQQISAFLADPAATELEIGLSGQPGLLSTIFFWGFVVGCSVMPLWLLGLLVPALRGPMPASAYAKQGGRE